MNIFILMMVFILGGVCGWIYEILFYFLNSKCKRVYMRGRNFLPFINIYAIGSVILVLITYNFRKEPLIVFLLSILITGVLELLTGLVLDKVFNTRLWDYNKEILNLGNIAGYVCLRSVLIFGIGGLFLVCGMMPIFISLEGQYIKIVSGVLFSLFLFDMLYNLFLYKVFKTKNARTFYESKGLKYLDF